MTTFREWFTENLSDYAADIARHGADAGYPHITYTSDCVKVFDQFADEIWERACDDADNMGNRNVCEMIAGFSRSDMLGSYDQFRNLMVWYMCEEVARGLENADDEAA
jgi:hypothetical protein